MFESAVVNASPLIYLGRTGNLHLIEGCARNVWVPDVVLDEIRAAFIEFVNKVPFYGAAILCLDDPNVQGILPEVRRRTITYGTTSQTDFEASDIACGHFASDFALD